MGDVAQVEDGEADVDTAANIDGKGTVLLNIRRQSGTNTVEVVNAGHNPGFLLSEDTNGDKTVHEIEASGTPIGLVPMMQYSSETLVFHPGSRLLFYTDGLTEVFRGDEEFGPERLLEEFSKCRTDKADAC